MVQAVRDGEYVRVGYSVYGAISTHVHASECLADFDGFRKNSEDESRWVTYPEVDRLYDPLTQRGTVRQAHALLRASLNQAERWGLIGPNVAKLASPPPMPQPVQHPPTPEEVRALLVAASELAPYSGPRSSWSPPPARAKPKPARCAGVTSTSRPRPSPWPAPKWLFPG
ncbi:MAG: hypothetical protein GY929_03565 [Actinomycetia bacterium]|nr:hypothetical protein [Actinomycetes bacterium]